MPRAGAGMPSVAATMIGPTAFGSSSRKMIDAPDAYETLLLDAMIGDPAARDGGPVVLTRLDPAARHGPAPLCGRVRPPDEQDPPVRRGHDAADAVDPSPFHGPSVGGAAT